MKSIHLAPHPISAISSNDFAAWTAERSSEYEKAYLLTLAYPNSNSIAAAGTYLKQIAPHFWRSIFGNNFRRPHFHQDTRYVAFLDAPAITYGESGPSSGYWHHHCIIQLTYDLNSHVQTRLRTQDDEIIVDSFRPSKRLLYSYSLQSLASAEDLHFATIYSSKNTRKLLRFTSDAYILQRKDSLSPDVYEKLR